MKIILFIALTLFVITQCKDKKDKDRTYADVAKCSRLLLASEYYKNSSQLKIQASCVNPTSDVRQSNACQYFETNATASFEQNDGEDAIPSKVMKYYKSCAKKCKKWVEDEDGETKEIAERLLECSQSILVLSALIIGTLVALLF